MQVWTVVTDMKALNVSQAIELGFIAARNLVLGGNLASLSFLPNVGGLIRYTSETLFLHRALTNTRGLPDRPVYEVLSAPDSVPIQLSTVGRENWLCEPVGSYCLDLVNLCLLARILKPKMIFEIGTLNGYTSLHFAMNSPEDTQVFTLDLPRGAGSETSLKLTGVDKLHIDLSQQIDYVFESSPLADRITPLFGDSARFDYTPYHGKVDLFFIDGAHSYEYVRSDTMKALECCHSGSVIAWHDFGRVGVNGVSRWLTELSKRYTIYSPRGGSLAYMVVP